MFWRKSKFPRVNSSKKNPHGVNADGTPSSEPVRDIDIDDLVRRGIISVLPTSDEDAKKIRKLLKGVKGI